MDTLLVVTIRIVPVMHESADVSGFHQVIFGTVTPHDTAEVRQASIVPFMSLALPFVTRQQQVPVIEARPSGLQ